MLDTPDRRLPERGRADMFIDMQCLPAPLTGDNGFTFTDLNRTTWEYDRVGSDTLYQDHIEDLRREQRGVVFHQAYERARLNRRRDYRNQILTQLRPNRRWRLDSMWVDRRDRGAYDYVRASLRDFAKAIQDDDGEAVMEALKAIDNHCRPMADKLIEDHLSCGDIDRCSDCGELVDKTSENYNYTIGGDLICDSCVECYVYSECQDAHIHEDHACCVYGTAHQYNNGNSEDYCTRDYGERRFYGYEGAFFTDEWERDEAAGYHDDEEEEDEEDEDVRGYLNDYHGASRNFVEQNKSQAYPALGVELEVYAQDDRRETVAALRDDFPDLIFERDGSLDDDCGFEIITQPYGREEWNAFAPNLTKALVDLEVVGYNEPAGQGYGIHVTVHRRHFSPLAEARVMMFLTAAENLNFVRAIAQRNQIYSADSGRGFGAFRTGDRLERVNNNGLASKYHRHQARDKYGDLRYQQKITGYGKYCPVNWKRDLAEFRLFQSTINPSSFMKNLEFVWALHAWTKPEAATGSSFHHLDFVRWLNTPERRKEFPFLSAFLSKKKFYGTNFEPILSTWRSLMVKPVETEAVEPMLA